MKKLLAILGLILCIFLISCTNKNTQFTVTYHIFSESGTTLTETYDKNYSLKEIEVPSTKEGYAIEGWYLDSDFKTRVVLPYTISKDENFYAKWVKLHKITFFVHDTEYETEFVMDKHVLDYKNAPTLEGETFIDWYIDEDYQMTYDFESKVFSDFNLYAKYETQTLNVKFYDGTSCIENQLVTYNSHVNIPNPPTKEGLTFKGWSMSIDQFVPFDFTTPIQKDTTLYAYFEENIKKMVTITLLLENQTIPIETEYGKPLDLDTFPEKEGYELILYADSDKTKPWDSNKPIEDNLTLYGTYKILSFSINFIVNEEIYQTKLADYHTTIEAISAPEKAGYTFQGWSLNPNKFEAYDFSTPIIKDISLYAYYEATEYTVTFMNEALLYYTCSATYNSTISFPISPTKKGYIFKGWSSKEQEYVAFTSNHKIFEDITLYAFYTEEISITLIIDSKETKITVGLGSLIPEPEQPTKEGYQFLGWYLDDQKFDFTTPITESIILVAKFKEIQIDIQSCGGYNEGFYFEAIPVPNVSTSDYKVSYRKKGSSIWTNVDSALIRLEKDILRCDAVGLEAGEYEVTITILDKSTSFTCTASAYDRSGYAHFKSSEIGAYTTKGTLKANAVVVYVTDQNKNTVTAKIGSSTYTGLSQILQKQNGSVPVVIRILGTISAATWNKIDYKVNGITSITPEQVIGINQKALSLKNYSESELISGGFNNLNEDISAGITKLNGLTNQIKYDSSKKEFDSYYNMLDISNAKNVTVEGIGTDAKLYQWGFTWKNCSSIEIRNLTFDDYTEDACSFEGSDDSETLEGFKTGQIWIHHNTFNEGKNNWDVCNEQDKHEGDGATDFKKNAYITVAYNHYYKNHKTGLVGGSDTQHTACITFHHNFYDQCTSRLPLGRQANMHMYNNYYYKSSGTNMSIRANGYALVENCVLENVNNPFETKTTAIIKSFNNLLIGCKGTNNAIVVNSRTDLVENSNPYGTDFDTNPSLFYYDPITKTSKVTILHETKDVKAYCMLYAGVLKNDTCTPGNPSEGSPSTPPTETEEWKTWLKEDFSSTIDISSVALGTIPKEAGIYYAYSDGGSQETNHLSISNGKLNIMDISTISTTYGYYIFRNLESYKKLKLSLDFTPLTANGKWTPIHFLDHQQNLGIRTDTNKYLGYTLDNGASHIKFPSSMEITANQTYSIELIIDTINQTTTLKIGTDILEISNYAPILKGILFQTATAERSFSIDNLQIDIVQS